jgi:hypothetical protein
MLGPAPANPLTLAGAETQPVDSATSEVQALN